MVQKATLAARVLGRGGAHVANAVGYVASSSGDYIAKTWEQIPTEYDAVRRTPDEMRASRLAKNAAHKAAKALANEMADATMSALPAALPAMKAGKKAAA